MALPLDGIRVIDLSNVLAGPFCAFQLAMMGAEVIKVESPDGGDLARRLGADPDAAAKLMGLSFLAVNAGKQSITINLKHPRGKEILKKLVAVSDVLVENFRPGVMERLGLDFPILKQVQPGLIYCAISGFGQSGPWSDRPAYDQIIQGLSGLMSVTGDADSAPLRVGFPVCDTIGGMSAAFAIVSSLAGKARTGEGAFIDVSMLEATMASMGWVVSNYLATGRPPVPMGNENMTAAPSGTFKTSRGLLNIAANEQRQFESLCDAIGNPALKSDARFRERESRKQYRAELKREIEAGLASKSAAEWEGLLNTKGVPAGQVLTVPEVLSQQQVTGRDFIAGFDDVPGLGGPAKMSRGGFMFNGASPKPKSPPPPLGAHTATWLGNLGYDAAEIAALRLDGAI